MNSAGPDIPPGADSSEFRELYPFESRFLKRANEPSMHYLDEGQGEPLLCLHGNPTWSFFYRDVVKAFREAHRCVVPDHIGCGFSAKPQDYPYRLEQHIRNTEILVEDLGLREITLVVHDWGGAIGMGVAVRRPELVKRIVIFNTAAFPSKRIPWRIDICRIPLFGALVIRGLNGFALPAVHMATTRRGGLPGPVRRGFLLPYRNWKSRVALHRFVRDIPMKPAHPSYPMIDDIGRKIHHLRALPMLICWAGRDFCFNDSFLAEWERRFPNATIQRFPHAGHYLLEDAGDETVQAMRRFFATER